MVVAIGIAVSSVSADPALAATSGSDYAYAGPGSQYAEWNRSQKRLSLRVNTYTMSSDRCIDSMLDWQTTGGHYDSRVVRVCRNNRFLDTDPGGDGYWSEPTDWGGRTITDMQKGWGAYIDDDYINGNFPMYEAENFSGAGSSPYSARPRTCTDKWARMRTLYQSGNIVYCTSKAQYYDS